MNKNEDEKEKTILYWLGDAAYLNITNRCTCSCTFCLRQTGDGVGGYTLWLPGDVTPDELLAVLEKERPKKAVFCGYGEPTMNLEALLSGGRFIRSYGGSVRIDTNGHANLVHGRDVTSEIAEAANAVSISLNAATPEHYAALMRCQYGKDGYDALLDFGKLCKGLGMDVRYTVVDVLEPDEIAACARVAEDAGGKLAVRPYVA